ncbi:MAG: hypothetical protein ACLRM9_10635 [Collinsella aerofaciens]
MVREAQAIDGIFVGEHGGKPRGGYAALFAHSMHPQAARAHEFV